MNQKISILATFLGLSSSTQNSSAAAISRRRFFSSCQRHRNSTPDPSLERAYEAENEPLAGWLVHGVLGKKHVGVQYLYLQLRFETGQEVKKKTEKWQMISSSTFGGMLLYIARYTSQEQIESLHF